MFPSSLGVISGCHSTREAAARRAVYMGATFEQFRPNRLVAGLRGELAVALKLWVSGFPRVFRQRTARVRTAIKEYPRLQQS